MAQHLSTRTHQRSARPPDRPSPQNRVSVYEQVTSKIVEALSAGVVPWRKPWNAGTAIPCNAVSKRPYHGINLLLLGLTPYDDHRWLTYRQAEQLGGHVRSGERASLAVFWKLLDHDEPDEAIGETRQRRIPLLRHYYVFNLEQCEGLTLADDPNTNRTSNNRIEEAEQFVRSMPNPPRLHEGFSHACYYPRIDVVQMPRLTAFETADAYYATLLHELGHATGHESRLDRAGVMNTPHFGSADYSREELVAELTSAFCCATLGLDNSLIDNAASYIDHWIQTLKADPKAIVVASGQAQRAADYIRGGHQDENEEPEGQA